MKTRERRELMREWVEPLHQALAALLGISEYTDPRTYPHVPVDFTDDAQIRIGLPVDLRFKREETAELVMQKLALENATFSWRLAGRDMHVLVKKTHCPPSSLGLADPGVRDLLASVPESAPLIGLGAGGKTVSVDLDHDSPHVLISADTDTDIGGGKSTILRTITSQPLHNGAQAHILDVKIPSSTHRGTTWKCRWGSDCSDPGLLALRMFTPEGFKAVRAASATR